MVCAAPAGAYPYRIHRNKRDVCATRGKVPAERETEGIRLAFEGGGVEFNEEVSGRTLFLLTRPGASGASKAPAPKVDTNRAPTKVEQ